MKPIVVKIFIELFVIFLLTACGVEADGTGAHPNSSPNINPITTDGQTAFGLNNLVFYHDFNDEKLHTYTDTDIITTWNSGSSSGLVTNAVSIVQDPDPSGSHGKVMRVSYAANKIGTSGGGSQWRADLEGVYDELYLSYDVFFTANAEFVKGGKLPGLMGGPGFHTGGNPPDGTDGWTGRLMWWQDGGILGYMYHAEQPSIYGENFYWNDSADGQTYFQAGQWNRVEIRYAMNTPGIHDGNLQAWFNGQLVLDRQDVMYREPGGENVGIDKLLFSTFYGGGDSSWAPSTDQYIYFDNFVVSKQPITHY